MSQPNPPENAGAYPIASRFLLRNTRKSAEENGTVPPNRQKNATDYTSFSPLAFSCVSLRLHLPMAKKPKSVAPRFEECERKVCGKRRCRLHGNVKWQRQSVRFRSHSFARSVADLGFSPDGNGSGLEAKKSEWARNRIIGHGFRTGSRTGCLIPYFPFPSVSSVVKQNKRRSHH